MSSNAARDAPLRCQHCQRELAATRLARSARACPACLAERGLFQGEQLFDLERDELDALPYGIVELDAEGTVLAYNRREEQIAQRTREQQIGRNFFAEVAPCTNVRDFAGRFRELVDSGRSGEASLEFVFRFPWGSQLVWIQMMWSEPERRGFLVVEQRG